MTPSNRALPQIGYCMNVHAGSDLAETRRNLEQHTLAVKQQFRPNEAMGIGLWLPASTAAALSGQRELDDFGHWLSEAGLVPFTMNGFPFGNFHQKVVKYDVYQPPWWDKRRLEYTKTLIDIQSRLLGEGQRGSISTLPIAWRTPAPKDDQLAAAGANLIDAAKYLAQTEAETGCSIRLAIEPEPGAYLQRSGQCVDFFDRYVMPGGEETIKRRHLTVCHDVCHAAVMFEPQAQALENYRAAGLRVGKVQISSAIHVPLDRLDANGRTAALEQLRRFAEDRYLHQTVARSAGGTTSFYDDLPQALDSIEPGETAESAMRIHFHVPVYLDAFGLLSTTQNEIAEALRIVLREDGVDHYEVETYAWGVLPDELHREKLADGIADEMRWFESLVVNELRR